jgi:hypothetical protein
VSTLLHPMSADPNDPIAAFSEYAADRLWVASHLGQFIGIVGIGIAVLALGRTLRDGPVVEVLVMLGGAGMIASVATAAALQAVDGVALKPMVDAWVATPLEHKDAAFRAAYAVRRIEIGLASFTSLLFGLTTLAYSLALLATRTYPGWVGAVGLVGGLGLVATAVAQAYSGFSALAMDLSMPSSLALLLWLVAFALMTLKSNRRPA